MSTTVTMKKASGVDTQINLPDGTTLKPDASGNITAPAQFVTTLLAAGYQIVVDSGTTHVP